MKKILVLVLMGLMSIGMWADGPARVPAYRGLIERKQPNGYVLRTYLRGDEHKHWNMTEDGWLKYVKTNRKGELVTSCKKARNAEDRSKCQKRWLEKHGKRFEN